MWLLGGRGFQAAGKKEPFVGAVNKQENGRNEK